MNFAPADVEPYPIPSQAVATTHGETMPSEISGDKGAVITALHTSSPLFDLRRVAYRDRVRVPDGRIGAVAGFYRRTEEVVLVSFSAGTSVEFLVTEVEAL